jgi:hypothetical protein
MYEKVISDFNYCVFIAATIAIAGVFYEGMALKWYDVVGILILIMDYTFFISTVINMVTYKKTKWVFINAFSLLCIIAAFIMKFLRIQYPVWGLVLWYFYIWFLYGIQISKKEY